MVDQVFMLRNIDVGVIQNHINKMYISNRHYRLAEMTLQNLPECAKLLSNSFIKQNRVWSIINPSYEEVYKFMFDKTKQMLEWQNELRQDGTISPSTFLNFVYLDKNDKVVAVATNFELRQYLTKKSNVHFSHFAALEKIGHQLEKNIIQPDTEPGRSVYAMFSAVDQEVMGVGLIMLFWIDYGHYLHANGFRILYARMSNAKTFGWVQKFGGMINKLKVEINDQKMTFSFIRWYLDPLHYNQYAAKIFKGRAKL